MMGAACSNPECARAGVQFLSEFLRRNWEELGNGRVAANGIEEQKG